VLFSSDWFNLIEVVSDVVIGVTATAAIAVTIWQFIVQRRHNRISVCPHIVVSPWLNFDNWAVEIQNHGLGPARVTGFSICGPTKKWASTNSFISDAFPPFIRRNNAFLKQHGYMLSLGVKEIPDGSVIPPGYKFFLINIEKIRDIHKSYGGLIPQVDIQINHQLDNLFLREFGNLDLTLEYDDFYGTNPMKCDVRLWRVSPTHNAIAGIHESAEV
jgi:hypothetical protein